MKKILVIASGCLILIACNDDKTANTDTKMASEASDSTSKTQAVEFADRKYIDQGKKQLADFQSGNIDAWLGSFSDNAKYYWSGGDSLIGKQAIADYWKNRRGTVIKDIKFSNDIWLPVKVNTPQRGPDLPGVWLMTWYQVNATYNTGKSVQFWAHQLFHFDNSDKIDQAVSYIDMAPIKAALATK